MIKRWVALGIAEAARGFHRVKGHGQMSLFLDVLRPKTGLEEEIEVEQGRAAEALPAIEAKQGEVRGWAQRARGNDVPSVGTTRLARKLLSGLDIPQKTHRALERWQASLNLLWGLEQMKRDLGTGEHGARPHALQSLRAAEQAWYLHTTGEARDYQLTSIICCLVTGMDMGLSLPQLTHRIRQFAFRGETFPFLAHLLAAPAFAPLRAYSTHRALPVVHLQKNQICFPTSPGSRPRLAHQPQPCQFARPSPGLLSRRSGVAPRDGVLVGCAA